MKTFSCFLLFAAIHCFFSSPCLVFSQSRKSVGFREAGRLAVAASLEIKNSRAQQMLRERIWVWGIRAFFPQLSFQIQEDDRLSLVSADSFIKTYTVNLEQLLFDGGRVSLSRKMEQEELILFADQLKRDESAVAEAALSAYRQILCSRMIAAIRGDALVSLKEQRRILAEEFALGMVIPVDLAQADITVRETELELEFILLQLEELEKQFSALLGLGDMPELSERVDIYRSPPIPDAEAVRRSALARNPDLGRMAYSIRQREAELKLSSRAWIPTVKATGSYSLSGQHYPLTRQSWTFGLSMQFSSPWLNAGGGGSAGWERPYDRNARAQTSFTPLPDPAAGLSAKQAALALAAERENYQRALERLGREAVLQTARLRLGEQRRAAAVEAMNLGAEKYRLSEVLLSLGRITRLELMENRLEYAGKETAAAEAAAALMETERALEQFIDLPPGSLEAFSRRTSK
ncbi:MAG: TolC family protein [Spirochaetaceae bacterium]|jgi:outer membrane protein TolC|nr:TolC family protein [Spirochaetaceae bacterium]